MAIQQTSSEAAGGLVSWLGRHVTLNWVFLVFVAIFVLAVFTRFHILGERVMSHDESLHTRFSYNLYAEGDFRHTPLMHGPILFHATAFSYAIFGANDFSARIYTAVLGVLMVMSPLLFRRWLGRWGTILASVMLLISPLILYYNRYIRHDTPSMLFAILMIWGIMMYLAGPENQRRRAHWLYVIAASMVLNLGSKETAFIYIAVFGVFLALYWFVRLAQHFWKIPGKVVFQFLILGILLAGVLSLGMYIILDIIQFDLLPNESSVTFGMLSSQYQTIYFVWTFAAIAVVMTVVLGTLFWAYWRDLQRVRWLEVLALIGITLAVCFALVVLEEVSHTTPTSDQPVAPVVPGQEGELSTGPTSLRWTPMIGVWAISGAALIFLLVTRRRRTDADGDGTSDKPKIGEGFWTTMDRFPEVDVMVVIFTLILPWATAFVPYFMGGTEADYAALANNLPTPLYNIIFAIAEVTTPQHVGQFVVNVMAFIPLVAVAVVLGLMWNWRRWLVAAAIFHAIFVFFFTTVFTNMAGLATGMIYSLGYWLEQQGVRRGSQPQYYYLLVVMPVYEFLPVIGSVLAMLAGLIMFWRRRRSDKLTDEEISARRAQLITLSDEDQAAEAESNKERILALQEARAERNRLKEPSFLLFMSWLGVLNLVGYSLAGEKMPWLGTHLTLPLIFLTAWYFGRTIDRIDLRQFRLRGWLLLFLLPLLLVAAAQAVGMLVVGRGPFGGLSQPQLQQTYSWLAAVAVSGAALWGVALLARAAGWSQVRQLMAVAVFGLLALITFRSSWMASFIRYDEATEYLVYAHSAPAVKWVLEDIRELSLRTTGGMDLRFAYDDSVSWPYSWYFRDFTNAVFIGGNPTLQNLDNAAVVVVGDDKLPVVEPLLEDRYQRFRYIRMWWPMQDYFYLTPERVFNTFDFSPGNWQAARIREGLFDIWWYRDYSTYGQAVDKVYDLTSWPVSDIMYVYVRKDYAAQIWEYGVGDGSVENPLDEIAQNVCNANWVSLEAVSEFNVPAGLQRPLGLDIGPDGSLYVAEEFGHRISVFAPDGSLIETIGQPVGGQADEPILTRPNSVRVLPDGRLLVVDTWDYGLDLLSPTDEVLIEWGQPGEYGFAAETVPTDGLWGPRDAAVDPVTGRVYVSDTGNKRVRVYTLEEGMASFAQDIADGGSAPGQLDEPSGLALHPDGRLFVADTWNRRISVFNAADGSYLTTYPVRGWYQELGNRPYVAVDPDRELLYVTDPDAGRILVYSTDGECLGSFGTLAGEVPMPNQFGIAGGVTVDSEGYVYVSDPQLGRVLKFESFDAYRPIAAPEDTLSEGDSGESGGGEGDLSVGDELDAEAGDDDAPPSE